MDSSTKLHTVDEVAEMLRTTAPTVRHWVHHRKITSTKIGRRRLVPAAEVERLIREGTTPRQDAPPNELRVEALPARSGSAAESILRIGRPGPKRA